MEQISSRSLAQLAEAIIRRMTVEIEASGRHVHLSRADLDALFGTNYVLTPVKELSQPGQFACAERVSLVGPRGELSKVVVLGPTRPESQVEISLSDAAILGLKPPVRLSGDVKGTPGICLRNGERAITLKQGVLVAKRHIHMTKQDAARFQLENGQKVRLRCFGSRPLVFEDVELRVGDQFATVCHLDYDEANACGFSKGDRGLILP